MNRRTAALLGTLFIIILLFSAVITSAQNFGTNWTAQYYKDANFGALAQSKVDPSINFNFGAGAPPVTGMPADNFSIRWTGVQSFASTGTYTFIASFDDTIRVFLDNQIIIDSPTPQNLSVNVNISAGAHTIIVEYKEYGGNAFVQLQWSNPGVVAPGSPSATAGPTFTPTATALPFIPPGSITATVIRASVLNVRDAPSLGGLSIGHIFRGQTYAVVGRNPQATWFLLQLSGKRAWAWGYYLYIDGNEYTPPIVSAGTTLGLAGQPDYGVVGRSVATLRLRAAPTVASAQIGKVTWGAFVPVIGRTPDGAWWQVVWKNTVGWVYSPFMKVFMGNLNNVPVKTG